MSKFKLIIMIIFIFALIFGVKTVLHEKNEIKSNNSYENTGLMLLKSSNKQKEASIVRNKRWSFHQLKKLFYNDSTDMVYIVIETTDGRFLFIPTTLANKLPTY